MIGFFQASQAIYGRAPKDLKDVEYQRLLAVLIAPGRFRLLQDDAALDDRVARIQRLVAGDCSRPIKGMSGLRAADSRLSKQSTLTQPFASV